MLNSVPESMRACLIEAAKLAGPAFKRKAAEPPLALGGGAAGPLSFNIQVDASSRSLPPVPPPAPGPMAAFAAAAAAAAGPGSTGGQLAGSESDPLIPGLIAGPLPSDPLLAAIPPLPVPPLPGGEQPAAASTGDAAGAAPAAGDAAAAPGGEQQQLLDLIRWELAVLAWGLVPACNTPIPAGWPSAARHHESPTAASAHPAGASTAAWWRRAPSRRCRPRCWGRQAAAPTLRQGRRRYPCPTPQRPWLWWSRCSHGSRQHLGRRRQQRWQWHPLQSSRWAWRCGGVHRKGPLAQGARQPAVPRQPVSAPLTLHLPRRPPPAGRVWQRRHAAQRRPGCAAGGAGQVSGTGRGAAALQLGRHRWNCWRYAGAGPASPLTSRRPGAAAAGATACSRA